MSSLSSCPALTYTLLPWHCSGVCLVLITVCFITGTLSWAPVFLIIKEEVFAAALTGKSFYLHGYSNTWKINVNLKEIISPWSKVIQFSTPFIFPQFFIALLLILILQVASGVLGAVYKPQVQYYSIFSLMSSYSFISSQKISNIF